MILGVAIVAVTSITYPIGASALYDQVDLYDGVGYDNILVLDKSMTKSEMEAYFATNQDYVWEVEHVLYAEFISNLFGGNISISSIENFWLYRRNLTTDVNVLVRDDIEADASSITDYTAPLGASYRYTLSAIDSNDETSNTIASNDVASDYYGWFLIDYDADVSFKFDIDVKTSNFKSNATDKVYVSPLEEKPVVYKSEPNYLSGTINCKIGYMDEDCEYTDTIALMDLLISTVKNGNEKYLKDRKGNVYRIEVIKGLKITYLDQLPDQIASVSFNFVEVRDE